MPTARYLRDLNEVHNPATGTIVPSRWGKQTRRNFEWLARRALVHAYTTALTVPNNDYTPIAFDAERRDTDGMHSLASATHLFTVQNPGHYFIWCNASFSVASGGIRQIRFGHNGFLLEFGKHSGSSSASVESKLCSGFHRDLAEGDTFSWDAYQNSGTSLTAAVEAGAWWIARSSGG